MLDGIKELIAEEKSAVSKIHPECATTEVLRQFRANFLYTLDCYGHLATLFQNQLEKEYEQLDRQKRGGAVGGPAG